MKLQSIVNDYRIYMTDGTDQPIFYCWKEEQGECNHNIGWLASADHVDIDYGWMVEWCLTH